MPDTPTVREAAEAWESLFRCQVGMMRRLQKLAEFKELNMREYDVLFNLGRCPTGSSRLSDLNEHLLISQPSLSRMAERLEAKGLVERRTDPSDQRAVLVSLTEAGRELQRRIGREHVRHIHELLAPALDSGELARLKELTGKISAALA